MAKFCSECGKGLTPSSKFCDECGNRVSGLEESYEVKSPYGEGWIFSRYKTDKYNNIPETLRHHLENHKIKDVRKFYAKGLELHYPEVLDEKLLGDDDEKGNFIFWEYRVAKNYKGLHQLQDSIGWGNRDYAFLTESHLVLINDSINLMMVAKDKNLFKVIPWSQLNQIVVSLDNYVERGFVTLNEWHWRIQFQLNNGQFYDRLLYIGLNENGFNENINKSQNMLAQMVYLCAQKGKPNIIQFVEGSSTLNDMTPRFTYGIFKEI